MVTDFPVWSIEDGLAESDWTGWAERLRDRIRSSATTCSSPIPRSWREAIDRKAASAALVKVNQIGTVTETLRTMRLCRRAGWGQVVAHRSGETEDTFIADLATGSGRGQLKTGAPARGERVAKYNRQIEIEATEGLAYGR